MSIDPRTDFLAVADWVGDLISATTVDQLGLPTPDEGWTVRDLLGHIVHVESTVANVVDPGNPLPVVEATDTTWSEVYQTGLAHIRTVFDEPGAMERTATTFFGPMPAGDFVARFTSEFLVHGWDLAKATGQDPEAPAEVAERTYQAALINNPAEGRNPKAFAAPVEPPAGAGPTTKLAAWQGRTQS